MAGRIVARLKGGDPYLFGRGSEEAEHLAANGVEFEVVPGVPSPLAAAAYAGISLSHRALSSSIAYVTASESVEKDRSSHDWAKLATATETLVLPVGGEMLEDIVRTRAGRAGSGVDRAGDGFLDTVPFAGEHVECASAAALFPAVAIGSLGDFETGHVAPGDGLQMLKIAAFARLGISRRVVEQGCKPAQCGRVAGGELFQDDLTRAFVVVHGVRSLGPMAIQTSLSA